VACSTARREAPAEDPQVAEQSGIERTMLQPELPENPTLEDVVEYLKEQQETNQHAYDSLAQRINEFLVERQETETTVTQFTASGNNVNLGDGIFFRVSTDASRDLTGLTNGIDGRVIRLVNIGSNDLVITNQDANSDAANRFLTDRAANVTVSAEEGVVCLYDSSTARWRVFSQTWT